MTSTKGKDPAHSGSRENLELNLDMNVETCENNK